MNVVFATRKSALALAQCRAFLRTLEARTSAVTRELHVTTTGDRIQDRSLSEIGGKGLFIKEIEEALLDGRADAAVHSMKDVPAELAPGTRITCIPPREDPHDVLVSRTGAGFLDLAPGSRVGTSSLRRRTLLAAVRPDLEYVALRGNVDTRLSRVQEGVVDAAILAHAGLRRLGLADRVTQRLEASVCLPAVGQGALAIQVREGDDELARLLSALSDEQTARTVGAERGVMVAVEGSCQIPVAAFALRDGEELWLRAMLAEADGSRMRRDEVRVPWPSDDEAAFAVGLELGQRLR